MPVCCIVAVGSAPSGANDRPEHFTLAHARRIRVIGGVTNLPKVPTIGFTDTSPAGVACMSLASLEAMA